MKTKRIRLCIFATFAPFLLWVGCGEKAQQIASNDPDSIAKLQVVSNPDLSKFEPKARDALQEQRQNLNSLIQAKDTPTSTLGLAFGQMGTQYFANRFTQPARECFQNAAFLQKSAFRWRYFLGQLHLEEQRPEEAQAAFEKVLAIQPQHLPTQVLLGQIALHNDDLETAESFFSKALSVNPNIATANYGMGKIMLKKGEFAKAALHLQTCLLVQPFARATHALLAKALHGMNQPEAAAIQERAVASRQPILREPLMNEVMDQRFLLLYRIAEALRLKKRDSEATPMYDSAINIRPDISGPRLGRALSLIRVGDHGAAVDRLEDDILAGGDNANFKHMLARLLAASPKPDVRNPQKALRILEALRKDHLTPGLVETIAMALATLEKYPSAIQYQENAIDMAMQAKQPDIIPPMEKNLALYRKNQPCQTPWAEDDPIFEIVTYQGEAQLEKRSGA